MEPPILDELFEEYKKVSNSKLNSEQFSTLVMVFPALLVIASDGVIDQEEWIYVKYLSRFIAETYKKEISEQELAALNQTFYNELEFLIDNLEAWESRFVDSLDKYLEYFPEQKETVMEALHLFAEASDGESEEEIEKIEELSKKLHLEE